MTRCHRCERPAGCVGRFRDGTRVPLCDDCKGRHEALAEAEEKVRRAEERIRRAALERGEVAATVLAWDFALEGLGTELAEALDERRRAASW